MDLLKQYKIDPNLIIKPTIYIILGLIAYQLFALLIRSIVRKSVHKERHKQKRIHTINILVLNVIKYVIIIIVLAKILSIYGIDVKSIIAGLGIAAAVIGLAFQDVAKDFLAGMSIIMEDQYEIGDTVEINGFMGEVVSLGLKTTRVRNYKGETLIIANHTITKVINYNLNHIKAIVDVSVGYEHSPEEVEKVILKMAKKLSHKIPNTHGEIELLGINELEESGVVYRVVVDSVAPHHIEVQRVLRKELKKALDDANIKIPYKQIEVHNGK